MGSPFGLTVIDLGKQAQLVTSPTYTDIFNSTMGVLGTDADGMPAEIAAIAENAAAFEIDVASGDTDLNDTLTAGGQQDVSTANQLAANLPGVTAAGDALLGHVDTLLTPISAPAPAPAPAPSGPYTPPSGTQVQTLPAMKAGGAVSLLLITEENIAPRQAPTLLVGLGAGDGSVFGTTITRTLVTFPGANNTVTDTKYFLTVTPSKIGTFSARVDVRGTESGAVDNPRYFQVTIS